MPATSALAIAAMKTSVVMIGPDMTMNLAASVGSFI
jgi:hypothetical protein